MARLKHNTCTMLLSLINKNLERHNNYACKCLFHIKLEAKLIWSLGAM